MNIKIQLDPADKVLLKHKLNKNGEGQRLLTHEVRRHCDKYVPFQTGTLKNTAQEDVTTITYNQPYADKQYQDNPGHGTEGTSNGGLRGRYWDKRMMANEGDEIVQAVADYCGGKVGK